MIFQKRFQMLSDCDAGPIKEPGPLHLETRPTKCSCCGSAESTVIARGRDYIYGGSDAYLTHVVCHGCKHIYLNPQPTIGAISIMYPPNYGTFSSKFRGGANLLALIKNVVNRKRFRRATGTLTRGMRVLDVGCGNGELLRALATSQPGVEFCGLDWHFPERTRCDLETAGIHLIEATLEAADLPESYFDRIVMYQLIEHLWEPQQALSKLARALKPGGSIVIETPDTDGYDRRLFASGTWGGYYVPRHLNIYNFDRLSSVLVRAGLELVQQKSLSAPVIWCYSLQAILQERFGKTSLLARLFDLRNVMVLGGFAALDLLAISVGFRTSNQQAIARKPLP